MFAYPDLYKYLVKQFQDQIVDAVPHVENVPYAVFMDELEEDFQSMTMRTFQIGDRIPFDFCGPDFSSTDQGTVIYRDTDHIFVQFTYMSPFAAYELNREGIPYEKVREIIGKVTSGYTALITICRTSKSRTTAIMRNPFFIVSPFYFENSSAVRATLPSETPFEKII